MLTEKKVNKSEVVFVDVLPIASPVKRKRKWECSLPEMVVGDYLVVPCCSAKMLRSESYWMNSCCRDYAELCAGGEYSVFSIRSRVGERLATLGLVNENDRWRFDQCYGPSNADVLEETMVYLDEDGELHSESFPTDLYYIAHEVVRLMNSQSAMVM